MVLPYHRVLGPLSSEQMHRVWAELGQWADVTTARNTASLNGLLGEVQRLGEDGQVMGVLGPNGDGPYMLKLKADRRMASWGPVAESEAWLLEEQILKPLLGESLQTSLAYVHDAEEAEALARSDEPHLAFFLKAFPLDLFQEIVDAGQKLPRKSTFFYPKLPTGIVINTLQGPL